MNYEKLKTKVKDNRKLITEILQSENLSTFGMAEFAIEEYMLGENCDKYSYHNFHDHFVARHLNCERGNHPKFGKLMTEVLDRYFWDYINDVYILIKKIVYEKMNKLDENGELWTIDYFSSTFEEWVGAWAQEIVEDENFPVDYCSFDVDEKKLKKYKSLKVSINKEKELEFSEVSEDTI